MRIVLGRMLDQPAAPPGWRWRVHMAGWDERKQRHPSERRRDHHRSIQQKRTSNGATHARRKATGLEEKGLLHALRSKRS